VEYIELRMMKVVLIRVILYWEWWKLYWKLKWLSYFGTLFF